MTKEFRRKLIRSALMILLASWPVFTAASMDLRPADENFSLVVQRGHADRITAFSWLEGSRNFVTASLDGYAVLWDADTFSELRRFFIDKRGVDSIACLPGQNTAIISTTRGEFGWWDLMQGRQTALLKTRLKASSTSCMLSPDGSSLLVTDGTQAVALDMKTKRQTGTIKTFSLAVSAFAWSSDNRSWYWADGAGSMERVDLRTGRTLAAYRGATERIVSIMENPIFDTVYSLTATGRLCAWKAESGEGFLDLFHSDLPDYMIDMIEIDEMNAEVDSGFPGYRQALLAVDSSGKKIYCRGYDEAGENVIQVLDAESGRKMAQYRIPRIPGAGRRYISSLSLAPDMSLLLVGCDDGSVCALDPVTGFVVMDRGALSSTWDYIATMPQGGLAAVAAGIMDHSIRLWNPASMAKVSELRAPEPIYGESMVFSSDGRYLAVGSDEGIFLWDVSGVDATASVPRQFAIGYDVTALSFSRSGELLAAGCQDGRILIVDPQTGKSIHVYDNAEIEEEVDEEDAEFFFPYGDADVDVNTDTDIVQLAFTGDDRVLISLAGSGKLLSRAVGTGEVLVMDSIADPFTRQAITIDRSGKRLYTLSNFTLACMDVGSPEKPTYLPRYLARRELPYSLVGRSPPGAMLLSSDDRSFFIGCGSGDIVVVDAESLEPLHTLRGNGVSLNDLALADNGRILIAAHSDGTIRHWNLSTMKVAYTGLYPGNTDNWLAYTDDGYWDGNPGCGDLVRMVKGMSAVGIDQFAVRSNRPDLMLERLGSEDRSLIDHYRSIYQKRLRKLGLLEDASGVDPGSMPKARILASRQDGRSLTLECDFDAGAGNLKSWNIWVNDVPLFGSMGEAASGDVMRETRDFALNPGINKIESGCMNERGVESVRALRFASWDGRVEPKLYFLGFGVSEYADPEIRDLNWAAKDASDLAKLFASLESRAYEKVAARIWTDSEVDSLCLDDARKFLSETRPEDSVILFISGHGIHDLDPEATYYYILHDTKLNNLPDTAVKFEDLEALLQGIQARNKLFLMDTCESGESVDEIEAWVPSPDARSLEAPGSGADRLHMPVSVKEAVAQRERWVYNDLSRRSGSVVISSCRGNENSYEFDDLENGAFTAALKSGFVPLASGPMSADMDGDGFIDCRELRSWIGKQVSFMVTSRKGQDLQHPTIDRDNLSQEVGVLTGSRKSATP